MSHPGRGLEPVSIAVAVSRGKRPDPKVVPQAGNLGKIMGKSMEIVEKSWENIGKSMENPMGKSMEIMGKSMKIQSQKPFCWSFSSAFS